MADRQRNGLDAFLGKHLHRRVDGCGLAADDGLLIAVDIGDDGVTVEPGQQPLHVGQRRKYGSHLAVVTHGYAGHFATAGRDGLERIGKTYCPGLDQRPVFAKAVAHDHVGVEAVGAQQSGQRGIAGDQRRLRDLGLHQGAVGLLDPFLVFAIHEDIVGQRFAEDRFHHPVSLLERLPDQVFGLAQLGQHVDVLRTLPRKQECDLA